MRTRVLVLIPLVLFFVAVSCQNKREKITTLSFEESAEDILAKLSLEEKVGQLFMIGFHGTEPNYYLNKMIRNRNIGGVILLKYNLESRTQVISTISKIQDSALSIYPPIPIWFSVDQEGGVVSRLAVEGVKEFTSQNEIKDTLSAYHVGLNRGKELRELGIVINYSPVVEHISDTNSFLFKRVFRGSTAHKTAHLARVMLRAYNQTNIIGVPKHFPGHTNSSVDSHGELPIEDIMLNDFQPLLESFREVLKENPTMVMTSHVMYPQIDSVFPATLSPKILSYLKEDLNFKGLIISDDMEMKAIEKNYSANKAPVLAILAGVDILMYTSTPQKQADAYKAILKAVANGVISETLIDEKVLKILKAKKRFIP